MDLKLSGKVAIVSGGSKGIGLATARLLASEGATVVISARSEATLETALAGLSGIAPGRVFAVAADMTDAAGVERVVAEARRAAGEIDIAVSNVIGHQIEADGKGPPPGFFQTVPPKEIQAEFNQLVLSSWRLARAVAPTMRERGWGRIINVSSGVSREPAWELPHVLPNMARPAAAALHRIMAKAFSGSGVTVNSILTGSIATDRNQHYFQWLSKERGVTLEALLAEVYGATPARRPGKPEEMAAAIAFLCSEAAGLINGVGLPVTGGVMRHIY
ncbi:MAG: putative 3-oxoacyl-[acyl-carrier protein] reductase [Phenylobacterium sp.]|nr:putative 3-oxoacyl-[acyl-carrier protein] reductase [Phenylobacterium sp.]